MKFDEKDIQKHTKIFRSSMDEVFDEPLVR